MLTLALERFLGLTPARATAPSPVTRPRVRRSGPSSRLRPGAPLRCFVLHLKGLPAGLRVWAVDRAGALACGRELQADLRLRGRAAGRTAARAA